MKVIEAIDPFRRLEQLLAQDQFELLLEEENEQKEEQEKQKNQGENQEEDHEKNQEKNQKEKREKQREKRRDLRLVYLMNDATESFLVFEHAVITGIYQADYEGELEASLECQEDAESPYILIVRQGDSVVTIFFRDLKFECHLYDYGQIGHFWVSGYEYLRQLEYRIAILRDKCEYLGEDFCTDEERKFASLAHFPPLNHTNYPAVPERYLVPQEEPWIPTEQAISVMEELAGEAGDRRFLYLLKVYRRHSGRMMARFLAMLLHTNAHAKVTDLLEAHLRRSAGVYPKRSFGKSADACFEAAMSKAKRRQEELEKQGVHSMILREEPFEIARDSIGFTAYLMIWKPGWINRRTEIEKWEGQC